MRDRKILAVWASSEEELSRWRLALEIRLRVRVKPVVSPEMPDRAIALLAFPNTPIAIAAEAARREVRVIEVYDHTIRLDMATHRVKPSAGESIFEVVKLATTVKRGPKPRPR